MWAVRRRAPNRILDRDSLTTQKRESKQNMLKKIRPQEEYMRLRTIRVFGMPWLQNEDVEDEKWYSS